MKIVLASSLYPPQVVGGAELVVKTLAEAFAEGGHAVYVLTLAADGSEHAERINGVEVRRIPIANFYDPFSHKGEHGALAKFSWHAIDSMNPLMMRRLRKHLRDIEPDVIQTHNLAGLSVAMWRVAHDHGIPVCHTLHDLYLLCPRTTMYRNGEVCERPCLDCQVLSLPKRTAVGAVKAVIGVSEFILDRHSALFADVPVQRVIYNGCSLLGAASEPSESAHLTPLTLGYLGRLHQTKGIGWLLDVLGRTEIGKRCRLIVGGRGDAAYEAELQRRASGVSVEWRGYVRPEAVLQDIDYLIVPSLWNDTAPRTVQESMAFGVPVICSARGGIPELVGDSGLVFEPTRPQTFVELLRQIAENAGKRDELAQRARARAALFSVRAMVDQHLGVLESLANGPSGTARP